ncbi:MAG TPA: gamma-glutamyltransferase [Steroidobacteraceae bacterium]|nr:gamma-glutamyltransferase [Steroidobacteraceae bacterium]
MRSIRPWLATAYVAASLLTGCATPATSPADDHAAPATSYAVAMPDRYSAEVATRILETGGNAVDAAVASAFTLAVTYPEAGNIGGGGFMLAWVDGEATFLDYREVAPAAATRDMYLDATGDVVDGLSLTGHRAVGVPGTVAGLWEAHRRHGKLSWSTVVQPAVELAERGFVVPPDLAQTAQQEQADRLASTNFASHFSGLEVGATFRQPQLAATLARVQAQALDGFYRGITADFIVQEMQRGGGLITHRDLEEYRPVWRKPLAADWRGKTVLSSPPPSSGGFALLQLLGMKDALGARFEGLPHNSAAYVHLVAEMEKRVFADRAEYAGDPDFVEVPIAQLIDPAYVSRRAAQVDPTAISRIEAVRPGLAESRHTTHFSIVDRWGNAVSNTFTLNTDFGSGVVVEGAGFLLNNEMDDFSARPGTPNFYGVVGADANAIEPRKRMLSSMAPTIVLDRDRRVELVVGTMGGSTIITSVFQTIVNVYDFGMSPQQAVDAARFHHQLLPPARITYDPALPAPTLVGLKRLGYEAAPHPWPLGDVQMVVRKGAAWSAASDRRGRGASRVFEAPPAR